MANSSSEDENQVYKILPGTTDSGKAYETNLIGLFALRFVSFPTPDVWFATNADGCGHFDDIVIYCKSIDTEDLFMIQCKHSETKKTLTQKEFVKPKNFKQNNFSLEKYSNSSFSFSSGPKGIICDTVQRLNEKLKFILFTNNDADASDILEEINYESLLILNTSRNMYKFNSEKLNELIAKEQLGLKINDDFLKKLVLFSNQVFNKNISCFIFQQMRELVFPVCVPDVVMKEIIQKYLCFINDWAHGQLGDHFLLTKTHITTKLIELLLDRYMLLFPNKNYELQESCKFDKWDSILLDKNITVIEVDDDDDAQTVVFDFLYNYIYCKIRNNTENLCDVMEWEKAFSREAQNNFYQTANNLLKSEMLRTIGNVGTITLFHLYKVLWKIKQIPLVLEVNDVEDFSNIFHILKLNEYKLKVVILNKSSCKLPHFQEAPTTFTNLTDLNHEKHQLVLEETVQLQGRPIKLQQLIEVHEALKKFITVKDIINIFANNNGFNIGNTFKELPKYHIIRTIPKLLLDLPKLKSIINHSSDIFEVYCGNQQYHLHNDVFIPNKKIERIQQPNVIVHKLIMDNPKDPHLEWIESTGNTEAIKSILSVEPTEEIKPISLTHALTHFTHKINVVSAHPGMGKSTAMNFLAWNAPIDKWILRINLNEYLDYYESKDFEKSHSNPIKHLIYFNKQILLKQKRNKPLDVEVFKYFLNKKSIIIQLDGFDEISPYYKDGVTKMIRSLCATEFRIWLTTRPVLKSYVEQTFDTIAVTLNPLTEDDQINFLTKYYEETLDQKRYAEEIKQFSEKLLNLVNNKIKNHKEILSEIPLHILLLAEVYTDACKSFINEGVFNVGEDFDLLHLYERFTQRKLEILSEKYGNYAKQVQFETYQQLCALKVLFPEKKLKDLEINEQLSSFVKLLPNITELVQKDGIIVAENETNMSFTHRTFAEYFSAKWLSMNLGNPSTKSIIKILFKEDFYVVRNIFDKILAKNCPLHMAIIDCQINKAKDLIKTNPELLNAEDAGGRLPIHLAASYGNQYPMPERNKLADLSEHHIKRELKFNNGAIEIIRDDKTKDILVDLCFNTEALHKDKILGFTALDYAIASNCLANLNVMIGSLKNSTSISLQSHQIKPYLYYCARYGYNSLMKVISPYIVHINLQIERNPVDVIPFTKSIRHQLFHTATICYNAVSALVKPNIVHINSKINKGGQTALHWAASSEDLYRLANGKCSSTHNVYYSLEKDSFDTVHFFLCCGADVKAKDKNGSTALHYAAAEASTNVMALLLANGADINAENNYNETPLHRAANSGSTDNVSFLLSRGANPHSKTKLRSTPVHYAACKGYTDVVSLLLDAGADVNATNESEETALYIAVRFNQVTTVQLLMSRGAVIQRRGGENVSMNILHFAVKQRSNDVISQMLSDGSDINLKDLEGATALHHAVKWKCNSDIIPLLLSNGADINAKDNEGKTVLHYASEDHSTDIVSLLLRNGADIHARDEEDKTALHHVAHCRWRNTEYSKDTASLLLSNGADPNAADKYGKTALHYSAESFDGITPTLLSNGADPTVKDTFGKTPLHYAAETYSTSIIRLLINKVDPDIRDNFGKTALHYTFSAPRMLYHHFYEDTVSVLLTAGADLNTKDNDGITILHQAVEIGYKEVVSFLICNGADIHAKDKDEKTPLHYAFPKSSWLVPFLLSNNADVNAVDKYGQNAVYYAKKYGFKNTVKILRNHGAKK